MLLNRASVALKIAIAVFLVAILVRLFFVVNESLNPTKDFSSMTLNSEIARNLVGGRGLVFDATRLVLLKKIEEKVGHKIDPADADEFLKGQVHVSNYQPAKSYEPGYPLFLAGLWKITGEKKFIFPSLVQVFLGGIAAIGVFSITRSFFALPVAALAGFLYALYIPEAKMSVVPYQYPWVGFITVFFTWLLIKMRSRKEGAAFYFMAIAGGIVAAVGTLMYSTLIFLPVLGVVVFFQISRLKRAFMATLLMLAVFIGLLSPLLLYNMSELGEFRIVTRPFWFNIARGLGHSPNPWGFLPDDGAIFDFVAKKHPEYLAFGTGNDYNTEIENYLRSEIIKGIKERPLWYTGATIERFVMAASPFHWAITQGEIIEDDQGRMLLGPRPEIELWGALIASVWIIIAFFGIWLARKEWRLTAPVLLVLLFFLGLHGFTVIHPYYLNVLSFVYAIFSAYALYNIFIWTRKKLRFRGKDDQ